MERITKDDLKRRLDAHERLTLVDVRAQNAWNASDVQLPDAGTCRAERSGSAKTMS